MTTPTVAPQRDLRLRTLSAAFWISGVFLPLLAIAVEAATAICATIIDPMPAPAYAALLLAVPLCNALAWLGLKRDAFEHRRVLAGMAGFSAAVSLYYTILFLPILPFAVIGVVVLAPALGLAPPLALASSVMLIRKWLGFAGPRSVASGAALGVAAILWLALPAIGVRLASEMLRSERPAVEDAAFWILRHDDVQAELLRASESLSSGDAREAVALLTGRGPLKWQEARELYYRATGAAYDSQPVPQWHRRSGILFDANRGSDRVGRRADDVRLAASRVDGSVDARSAVAYLEWTLVFQNSSAVQQEARTELALPPGAVVSRATLWVNGSEREAAFGERGQVRQAYEAVVRARRDPLLVTTSGPGRVLVQCFPIEPGGEMKIRLGITAPVIPEELSGRGVVALPLLLARNFDVKEPSSLWVESKAEVVSAGRLQTRLRDDGVHVIQGQFRAGEKAAIRLGGMSWGKTWAPDAAVKDAVVEQSFEEREIAPPERAVVVVDGSESMREWRDTIGRALSAIPRSIETRVIVATPTGDKDWSAAKSWEGGVDAVPALQAALGSLNDGRRGVVVWIAGEQAVRMGSTEAIRQQLERDGGRVKLVVVPCGSGNVPMRDLDGLGAVAAVPRLGDLGDDLERFFARWRPGTRERVAVRHAAASPSQDAERGSAHIVRLWAADQVLGKAGAHRHDAVELAVAHQIVTPLSGAVVLETAAQYAQNNLQPVSGSAVPTMPEPETWCLLAVGLGVMVFLLWRKRHFQEAHPCS